jgi:rhodanese-related sulfurtransferase
MKNLALAGVAIALGTLLGCAAPKGAVPPPGPSPAAPAGAASPWKVDGKTAQLLVRTGARLVDVRNPDEFAAGHIDGAILVPVDKLEEKAAASIGPPSTPVVVYCKSGRRSAQAAETLRRMGYVEVYDLGGMDAWKASAAQ